MTKKLLDTLSNKTIQFFSNFECKPTKDKKKVPAFLITLCLVIIFPTVGFSKDQIISGKFKTEFFDNYNYDSSNPQNEYNENYLRSKLDLNVKFNNKFYLKSSFLLRESNPDSEELERSESPKGGGNKSFEDEILYIKALNLNYDYKNATFTAGKFTTRFGQSFKRQDNLYLFEKSRDQYRQDKKLGFSSYVKAGNEADTGHYVVGLAVFTNDSKNLDGSTITKRDGTNKNDGNPGDKRGLKSYIASMDINYDFGNEEKLSYHLSYINLSVNDKQSPVTKSKTEDTKAYALNMDYQYPLHKNIIAQGFIEYANFNNHEGNIDKDVDFLTTILTFYFFKNYNITIGRYQEEQTQINTNGIDNNVRELSLGYKFSDQSILKGLQIMGGIKREKTDYKTSKVRDNVAGVLVRYIKTF